MKLGAVAFPVAISLILVGCQRPEYACLDRVTNELRGKIEGILIEIDNPHDPSAQERAISRLAFIADQMNTSGCADNTSTGIRMFQASARKMREALRRPNSLFGPVEDSPRNMAIREARGELMLSLHLMAAEPTNRSQSNGEK